MISPRPGGHCGRLDGAQIAAADALAVENRIFGNSLKVQKISVSSLKSVNRSQAEL